MISPNSHARKGGQEREKVKGRRGGEGGEGEERGEVEGIVVVLEFYSLNRIISDIIFYSNALAVE